MPGAVAFYKPMNIVLFDGPRVQPRLLPLTFTRPVCGLRVGIRTIQQKWEDWLETSVSAYTPAYLQQKFPLRLHATDNLYIHGGLCPAERLVRLVKQLQPGEAMMQGEVLLAVRTGTASLEELVPENTAFRRLYCWEKLDLIQALPDLVQFNGSQIAADLARIRLRQETFPVNDRFTAVYGEENLFLEEGVSLRACVLNAENGPIFLGKNVQVQEGVLIQGPFAALEGSVLNLGGKMRRGTTIGPHCKVGGEVSMSIIQGYTNKGHDGFLGNSVLGEWCNLGANTNNSNLKNDYGNVRLHSYATGGLEDTGQPFVGLFMGDYAKAGISTMFNTGTIVGVGANVYGSGFQPKYFPSFHCGGADSEIVPYRLDKALSVARTTMDRRGKTFDDDDEALFRYLYQQTHPS